jgi:CBS domain-containing protein
MGLELRIHMFFVLLLGFCIVFANVAGISITRAVVLWLLVLLAVLVRETARIIAAIYLSLDLRNVLLLPIGGLFAYASPESSERATEPRIVRSMAVVGPLANLGFAALLAAMIMAVAPGIPLLAKPWITPLHLLRGAVCINLLLAVIHLLPAYPLDMGRVLRRAAVGSEALSARFSIPRMLTQTIPILLFVCGAMYQIPWMLVAGFFIPIAAHLDDQGMLFQSVVDTVRMGDIMLTDFSALSPSDTLEDALEKAIHSLQDDFPVVRGRNLVGVVSKQHILDALRSDGNGYVQGIMMRAFHVAQPDDSLGSAFRRITGGRGLSLVPIIEGERIVGIVTLQNLMHSMGLLSEGRRRREQEQ